jgi:hypothetical protein
MGEVIGAILMIVIGIPLVIAVLVFGFFVYLYLGWIMILLWLFLGAPTSDPMFFGQAMISFGVYGVTALVLLFLPYSDDLPPALKFFAQFLPAPMRRKSDGLVDLPNLAQRFKAGVTSPFSNLARKFNTRRYQQAAEELRTDTDYQNAQAELHRAAQQFNRAKLRAEEAERARRHHGKG